MPQASDNAHTCADTTTPDDAELIAACEQLIDWERRYDAIYLTTADDKAADHAADTLRPPYSELSHRIQALGAPRTDAGRFAFAQAALAAAQRDSAENVLLDDGGGFGSYLAFGLAHSVVDAQVMITPAADAVCLGDRSKLAMSDLEPVVHDLRACVTLMGAMITEMQQNHDIPDIEDYAWRKLETDMSVLTQRAIDMWSLAFDQNKARLDKLKAEHEAAIEALKAEKAAPGSTEDRKRVDALWDALRGIGGIVNERCAEAGYPIELQDEGERA